MADTPITSSPQPFAWRVHQYREGNDVHITDVERVPTRDTRDQVTLRSLPRILSEDSKPSATRYEEVTYSDRALPAEARRIASLGKAKAEWPGSEVRELVSSGQLENRINLTLVGDGYTAEQKEKFFADAARIKDDLFAAGTFKSYQPLFNVHAVFVPSNESGLTDGDKVKDTALGLYRDPAGSKRGIMPGNPEAIDRAVALSPATDYPILMANDDFYGGLGGEYAITTRSERSGAVVLRHELGHNFGNVGEEYDGGQVYAGANHSDTADVPWKPWVDGDVQVYAGKALVGEYPWQNLQGGPMQYEFDIAPRTDGQKPSIFIDGSFVGWETPNDVAFLLDGKPVDVKADQTNDRGFFTVLAPEIAVGHHTLTVAEQVHDGDNVLANIRVTQYEPGYDFTRDKVEAYPSFDDSGSMVGYRPTHQSCPMRDMTATEFCAIDKENMWHEFLNRVSLIDSLSVGISNDGGDDGSGGNAPGGPDGNGNVRVIALKTPALQGLDIKWFRVDPDGNETELPEHAGKPRWKVSDDDHGKYRARVSFATAEVRTPDARFSAVADVQLT